LCCNFTLEEKIL